MPLQIYLPLAALAISGFALYFGYLRYLTKAGISIRGGYGTASSIDCNDIYVESIILENQKDRSATIFGIYLRIGYNNYLQIESFEDSPLVLKPFETYRKEFEPIEFYSAGFNSRALLNDLFYNFKVRKRLVLSTSQGRYYPKKFRIWEPGHEFFSNHLFGVIYPMRSAFKGKAYGSNIAYLIELHLEDGSEQVIPIHPKDYEIRRFRNIKLTKECLETKETLKTFIEEQQLTGNLSIKSFVVHDLAELRTKNFDRDRIEIEIKPLNAFQVFVLGAFWTKVSDWKLRRQNKESSKVSRIRKSETAAKLESGPPSKKPTSPGES